jgi:hypothetical protein
MQKIGNVSRGGVVYLMNMETGETTPWDGITEISSDDLEDEPSTVRTSQEAIEELSSSCDKTPNPIYIPKHIQHRKRGRR